MSLPASLPVVDLLLFAPLAVLTNSTIPIPFEPVLLWATAERSTRLMVAFCVLGAVCAAAAGLLDRGLLGAVGRRACAEVRGPAPRWFYAMAFTCALLPIPFMPVRVALVRFEPHRLGYAATIFAARLPRYLAITLVWGFVSPPAWVTTLVVLASVVGGLVVWLRRRRTAGDASPAV